MLFVNGSMLALGAHTDTHNCPHTRRERLTSKFLNVISHSLLPGRPNIHKAVFKR